jgi:LCP family protein required for cell wall assembly
MSRTTKPYRRYRARGGNGDGGGGLDELRDLTAAAKASTPAPPRPKPAKLSPGPVERMQRREAARRRRRWWSPRGKGVRGWTWRLVALAGLCLLVWLGAGLLTLDQAVNGANGRVTRGAQASLDPAAGGLLGTAHNTLIVGADALPGRTRSRADTILIMRTDPDAGRIRYLSIPRDFRVDLPRVGAAKINAAFALYGQQGIIRAVKRLTGLPIHHLIVLKFTGFEKMVAELGGVTVDNPTALEDCTYPGGRRVSFPAGRIRLDPADALVYARVRSCDNDFSRALRQQALLSAMKSEVFSVPSLWRAPWRGAGMVETMNTDIGTIDMVKFGWLQATLDQDPTDRILLSGEPLTMDGQSFVVATDPDANEEEIARFMGE